MKLAQVTAALLNIYFVLSCGRRECQAPLPTYNFAFINAQDQPAVIDSSQAVAVRLTYISATGARITVPQVDFRPLVSNSRYKFLYDLSYGLFTKSDKNQYTVEIGSKEAGNLSILSQINKSRCNGWMYITEVRFNNQLIDLDTYNGIYVIKVNP